LAREEGAAMILLESRELLDRFRRGDRAALLDVYRHYVRDVAHFLTVGFSFDSQGQRCTFRGFHGGYEIEAAIQEVFRRAFEERARLAYDGINPYKPYLLRIARNAVINDLKSRHPILFRFRAGGAVILEPTPDQAELEHARSADRTPEEIHEAREVSQIVERFLSALDPKERELFRLRFEEGLAAEEAGRRIGFTRSQVRTKETKLRERFLAHMKSAGYLTDYKRGTALESAAITALAFGVLR
jgi:RNA polymerase sigma-70 factor, ECF subfamily